MFQNLKAIILIIFILVAVNVSFAMYDPHTGRFMQQDPIGILPADNTAKNPFKPSVQYTDGFNIYQYLLSRPTVLIDPYGLLSHGKHIPCRGSLRISVGLDTRGGIKSAVGLDFKPIEDMQNYCDEIGFVQIEKLLSITIFTEESNDWLIDDEIPYSNSIHWVKGKRHPIAELSDAPGYYGLFPLKILTQDFESCAICLKGCEKGANYGCVRWGHSFEKFNMNPTGEKDFLVQRYAFEVIDTGWLDYGNWKPTVDIPYRKPNSPTNTFHQLIDRNLNIELGS